MTLNVQDSTGLVAEANGYLSVADFTAYHATRGNSIGSPSPSNGDIETAIVRATDYIDQRFNFVGRALEGRRQTTAWPRIGALDRDRNLVSGVPPEVKEACAEYALRALTAALNPDPERDSTGAAIASKSETVGPISESVSYVGGAVFTMPKYPAADQKLIRSGLVRTGGDVFRG